MCPVTSTIMTQGDAIPIDPARTDQFMNAVFRVERYATNYAGLLGRDLTPQGTIELPVDQTLRLVSSQVVSSGLQIGLVQPPLSELCGAIQSHAQLACLDQHRHQFEHRYADLLHRNQHHPPEPTAGFLSSHPVALTHGLVKAR